MNTERSRDIRRGERLPFDGTVQVSWQDRNGEMRAIRAKCLDLSNHGARIECQQAIELRTNIYVQAPAFGLMGNATVRYCRRNGTKHVMGIMFSSAVSQADQGRKRCLSDYNLDSAGKA